MTVAGGTEIRVRGIVQGVGFRPAAWKLANDAGLTGEILNDSQGVLVRLRGARDTAEFFIAALRRDPPALAHIESIEVQETPDLPDGFPVAGFHIRDSIGGPSRTHVCPDAATCPDCLAEVLDPFERRFRYPFASCTSCGPRLSVITRVPYDRGGTTMAGFALCPRCATEYADPADRRFHAQPIACHVCGPTARLSRTDGRPAPFDRYSMLDDVDAVATLVQKGRIVAIKGLGGYQLCCDATKADVVAELRQRKRRDRKPFALLARDLDVIRRFCSVDAAAEAALTGPAAPIVLLPADGAARLPDGVAPGLNLLGFMLPSTPLHHLMLKRHDRPVVLTSGNVSGEPQIIDDAEAAERLRDVADYLLSHDRPIAHRIDDSVVRITQGRPRLLRRARGFAPAPIRLPDDFAAAPAVLACGGELKSVFGLLRGNEAILSQHQGDLECAAVLEDFERNLRLYLEMFDHWPEAVAIDAHPDYLSSRAGRELAARLDVPLLLIQHHHAHVASCLAENGWRPDQGKVLGVALDGLGFGLDGTLWGGEFLLANYRGFTRVGTFKPVAMPGGAQAVRQPWRNLYAHLMAEMGWAELAMNFNALELFADLARRPRAQLDAMIRDGRHAPLASSCGRLFDAAGAALGLASEQADYEGEAAALLEAVVDPDALANEDELLAYPFSIPYLRAINLPYIEPIGMWRALLGDLQAGTPVGVIAARFHRGLAKVIAAMVQQRCAAADGVRTVALSGGCFHNAVLLRLTEERLRRAGFEVLTQSLVPSGDGGLALGQAAIAAALMMNR